MSGSEWADKLKAFAKGVVTEAIMPAAEKMIPQGAAEIGQALYTGAGYMPYGATERPMDSEVTPETFNNMLQGYAAQGRDAQGQNKEMGR